MDQGFGMLYTVYRYELRRDDLTDYSGSYIRIRNRLQGFSMSEWYRNSFARVDCCFCSPSDLLINFDFFKILCIAGSVALLLRALLSVVLNPVHPRTWYDLMRFKAYASDISLLRYNLLGPAPW